MSTTTTTTTRIGIEMMETDINENEVPYEIHLRQLEWKDEF